MNIRDNATEESPTSSTNVLNWSSKPHTMAYGGSVYILTNKHNSTLYVGATSEIQSRIIQHLEKVYPKSFTAKYNLNKLVYMEHFGFVEEAIQREKYIKGKSRQWKIDLINKYNPNWDDLTPDVLNW